MEREAGSHGYARITVAADLIGPPSSAVRTRANCSQTHRNLLKSPSHNQYEGSIPEHHGSDAQSSALRLTRHWMD